MCAGVWLPGHEGPRGANVLSAEIWGVSIQGGAGVASRATSVTSVQVALTAPRRRPDSLPARLRTRSRPGSTWLLTRILAVIFTFHFQLSEASEEDQ